MFEKIHEQADIKEIHEQASMKELHERANMKEAEETRISEKPEKHSPKIFLSGSIRGGRQLLETYRIMHDTIIEAGAEVLSWHVVDPELEKVESRMTEEEIYARDMNLLVKSEALIAEVTVPSTGVGYEICRALVQGIPVLCLHRQETAVSAMVLGNPNSLLKVITYSEEAVLKKFIIEFIKSL